MDDGILSLLNATSNKDSAGIGASGYLADDKREGVQTIQPRISPSNSVPLKVDVPSAKEDDFWQFVYDRQEIWHKRFVQKLPPPWTNDEIFKKYKFTNTMREMDRNTIYVLKNIVNNSKMDNVNKAFNVIVFRIFNRIETYEALGVQDAYNFDRNKMKATLDAIKATGKPVFPAAYMMCAKQLQGTPSKIDKFVETISQIQITFPTLYTVICNAPPEIVVEMLASYPGISNFLAYEFWCDLVYVKGLMQYGINDYVNIGPGAFKGLRHIFPTIKEKDMPAKIYEMWKSQHIKFDIIGVDFKFYQGELLNVRSIEHCLCEFDKYHRNKHGGFRPRVCFKAISPNTLYDK